MTRAAAESCYFTLISLCGLHNQTILDKLMQAINSNHCARNQLLQKYVRRLSSM
eukprot:XP_001704648.1 Hypothetical protein GL50803_34849 [Giardia lamblia ATCC 50803]